MISTYLHLIHTTQCLSPPQKKQKEQRERMRLDYARRREEERVNFWTDKLLEHEERRYWEEMRRYEEEREYYEWNVTRRMLPPPRPGPPGPRGVSTQGSFRYSLYLGKKTKTMQNRFFFIPTLQSFFQHELNCIPLNPFNGWYITIFPKSQKPI